MPQFDVYKNPRPGAFPLLLDVQADIVATLATRVVVPMSKRRRSDRPISRLNPTATIAGVDYILHVQELAAIPASALGARVTSLAPRRADLVAALDWLLTGG